MTGRIQSNPIFIRNICATTQEQSGSCIGDAGSGLVANNRLVGIASYIMGVCPSQRPEIYTEVSSYVRWIESHISEEWSDRRSNQNANEAYWLRWKNETISGAR